MNELQEQIFNYIQNHPGCTLVNEIFDEFGETQEVSEAVALLIFDYQITREKGTGKLEVRQLMQSAALCTA